MRGDSMPWYVRAIVGVGAWVTGVVLTLLGGAIMYALLEIEEPMALAVLGIGYGAFGYWLISRTDGGAFSEQLGIATGAAGAALIAGGVAAEFDSLWVGFIVSAGLLVLTIALIRDRILQFLIAVMVAGFYATAILDGRRGDIELDLIALATPVGLLLALLPLRRDVAPAAAAFLLTFPVVTVLTMGAYSGSRFADLGGDFARGLHILLFLGLAYIHWQRSTSGDARAQTLGFSIVAVVVCFLLPPGGSAAMLLLMYAFVVGSRAFAAIGALLQLQFLVRYYYLLSISLLDKSLLLMAVGLLLIAAWWFLQRQDRSPGPST